MANVFQNANGNPANPIIIDTAFGSVPAALTAIAGSGPQRFRLIRWVNPSSAGQECKITDGAGNVLFDEFASAPNVDVTLWDNPGNPYVLKQSNWLVPTLGGGKLYLWK